MRIIVKELSGRNIRLRLPSGLVMNRLSATILAAKLKKYNVSLSRKQLYTLLRAVKAYKAQHPQWKVVEIHSSNGEYVEIVL